MSQRHGPSATNALAAMLLLLSGCEAVYDDTKGWANRLEASILESAHELTEEPDPEEPSRYNPEHIAEAGTSQATAKAPMAEVPALPIRKPNMETAAVPPQAMATNKALHQMARRPDGVVADAAGALVEPGKTAGAPKSSQADKEKIAAAAPASPPRPKAKPQAAEPAQEGGDATSARTSADAAPAKTKNDIAMVLHLSSLRSEQAAKREWSDLQRAFPDRLGTMDAEFRRTELGDRGTFYRVLAGPLRSRAAAKEVCTALKAKNTKQYCRIMPSKPKA